MTQEKNFDLKVHHWWLITALVAAIFGVFVLVQPYINSLIMAFTLSFLCLPFHQIIANRFVNKPNLAAVVSCLLLTFIILIPLGFMINAMVVQGGIFSRATLEWINQGKAEQLLNNPFIEKMIATVNQIYPFETISIESITQQLGGAVSSVGAGALNISASILGNVTNVFVNFMLMIFVLFFLLRDNDVLVDKIRHVVPLTRSQEDRLLYEVEAITKSAILGSFATALAQGVAGGLAMWIVGFPGLFWGMVMAFSSFIPVVGTMMVWLPAALYLILSGEWQWGLFLIVWGVVVVGSIDNFLRPLIMQGNSGMNTLLVFFSLIGGINVFGLLGLIYGPLIFALALALFNLYEVEFAEFLERLDKS